MGFCDKGRRVGPCIVLSDDQLGAVLSRKSRRNRRGVEATLVGADVLRREQQVNAIRTAVHLLVNPRQLHFEMVERMGARSQHAQATGVGHCCDHIAAVTERHDREVDAEQIA